MRAFPFGPKPMVRYFQAGGNPEQVVELLSGNYHAIAQTANLLAEWLIMTGILPQISFTLHLILEIVAKN